MVASLNTKEQRKQRCPLKAHGFVSFVPLCLKNQTACPFPSVRYDFTPKTRAITAPICAGESTT